MLERFLLFFSPESGTGSTLSAKTLNTGSKLVALLGIFVFLIGIGLLFNTFPDEDKFKTTGVILEIADLPSSDHQVITLRYMVNQKQVTKRDTIRDFNSFNHQVGDRVGLLVNNDEVILLEALPALRYSFIKTSAVGIAIILLSVWLRRLSRK